MPTKTATLSAEFCKRAKQDNSLALTIEVSTTKHRMMSAKPDLNAIFSQAKNYFGCL